MKIPVEELIESVKDEICCYEEGEKIAAQWEKEFYEWLEDPKIPKKGVTEGKDGLLFQIGDEDEIFEIADSYFDALEENSVKQYWKTF